jgi:hypothetical protein
MARVLHPDTGNGDTVLMQQLNAARRGLDGAR